MIFLKGTPEEGLKVTWKLPKRLCYETDLSKCGEINQRGMETS